MPIEPSTSWKFHAGINTNGRRGLKLTSNPTELESFVDADEASKFLALPRRRVLELTRAGKLPAYPIGDGARRVWRFRLSELSAAVVSRQNSVVPSEFINSRLTTKAAPRAIE
jgi:excisionase family DNA binding protein